MSVKEGNAALLSQCLELCQTLSSKSLTFSFALTVGDSFSFSLDTRGEVALAPKAKKNKKKTPSALRRNARRRAKFLRKKLEASTVDSTQSVERAGEENGLKIHVGKAHKKAISPLATPDRLRQQVEGSVSLPASPLLNASREEASREEPSLNSKAEEVLKGPVSGICTNCDHCDEEIRAGSSRYWWPEVSGPDLICEFCFHEYQ